MAIELAAARIKLLPPQTLLTRLEHRLQVLTGGARDVPERQKTLRNTITWSYDLLCPEDQRLFRRLAVFVGGCTLHAAESISAALGDAMPSVLNGVTSLIDKNLLQQTAQEGEEPRLMMLETIREFGLELLTEQQEMEPTQAAHTAYYLALAEEADVWLWGPQQLLWLDRLEREHDNLRAALSWSLIQKPGEEAGNRKEVALRLTGALYRFWFTHGHFSEGRAFLEQALAASMGVATASRAKALVVAADLASGQQDIELGETLAEESLVLYKAVGDGVGIARVLGQLGRFAFSRNEYAKARSLLEESVALLKKLGNNWYLAWSLFILAGVDDVQGEHVKAQTHYEEALALWREQGDKEVVAILLINLANLYHQHKGDLVTARSISDEALMLSRESGSELGLAYSLSTLAEIALSQDDIAVARQFSEEALGIYRELGVKESMASSLSVLARVEARIGDYDKSLLLFEDVLTLAREVDDKLRLPFYLEELAYLVAAQEELVWSVRLWGAAEFLREAIASPMPSFYLTVYERAVAAARTHLGDQAFATAWAEGQTMTLEQVLTEPERTVIVSSNSVVLPSTSPEKSILPSLEGLTAREVEVLCLVAQGLTNMQIAEHLIISPRTVNTHLISIFRKIQVTTRSAATRYAIVHNLV